MKKVITIIVVILCLVCTFIINNYEYKDKKISISEYNHNQLKQNNILALMYETEAESGEYIESNDTTWPTGDYFYNETLSKCEKGSKISYDETTRKVLVEANISDKCYVYFDLKPKVLFANYIKGLYTTNGVNNLYLHDSNLANSAEDGSLRYAGSSETTNNFVCFGSDEETCANDDLYRIIGVFGDQVKLIKYDYANSNMLGTDGDFHTDTYSNRNTYKGKHEVVNSYYYNYKANSSASNNWETSLLNKTNLNMNYVNYLNNQNLKWVKMIANTKWNIGEISSNGLTAKSYINLEKVKQTSVTSRIAIMYPSDYGYATIPSNWSSTLNNYNTTTISDNNWILMGITEWLISPSLNEAKYSYSVYDVGSLLIRNTGYDGYVVRPVFYLNSNVQYLSGDGSQSLPYRIAT